MGFGQIVYATILEFSTIFFASDDHVVSYVRLFCFNWIGNSAEHIPSAYDELLDDTHATDLFSYASFYNLCTAYKRLASTVGPLPPAIMIRPSGLVFWNLLKGGVDEFSRALKSLCYTNASENPIESVLGRLLIAQVNHSAVVHRFALAKRRGLLPEIDEYKNCDRKKGYSALRHDVTRCETFASFARELTKSFCEYKTDQTDGNEHESECAGDRIVRTTEIPLKPLYCKDAFTNYNRPTENQRFTGCNITQSSAGKSFILLLVLL